MAAAILKIGSLAITHQLIVRFQLNFVRGNRTACQQRTCDKNCKFLKCQMVDSRHFENHHISVKKLPDFDDIWCTTADIEPDDSHMTKN